MQVDLSQINQEQFYLRPCTIAGEPCVLIEPHGVGVAKWDKSNLIFRSSIWTMDGKPVSLGFPKFMNWDEDLDKEGQILPGKIPYPKPKSLQGLSIMEKLDGSLLIVSKYKGELIVRTRGTISANLTLSNGDEIPYLRQKYPRAFEALDKSDGTGEFSLLFEWYSPRNKIVLNYGDEPLLWLVGLIHHSDYSLMPQTMLDSLSAVLQVPRPERYAFDNIEELRATVAKLEGKEGVVIYPVGTLPFKCKSARYMSLHYYKGDVATFDKVVDIWLEIGRPDYQTFYNHLETKYDWEIADYARGHISRICDAYKVVLDIQRGMEDFVKNQLAGLNRKQQAEKIFGSYGKTSRGSMLFHILDGKGLTDSDVKKLVLQNM